MGMRSATLSISSDDSVSPANVELWSTGSFPLPKIAPTLPLDPSPGACASCATGSGGTASGQGPGNPRQQQPTRSDTVTEVGRRPVLPHPFGCVRAQSQPQWRAAVGVRD